MNVFAFIGRNYTKNKGPARSRASVRIRRCTRPYLQQQGVLFSISSTPVSLAG